MMLAIHTLKMVSLLRNAQGFCDYNPPNRKMPAKWRFVFAGNCNLHNWGNGRHSIITSVTMLIEAIVINTSSQLMHVPLTAGSHIIFTGLQWKTVRIACTEQYINTKAPVHQRLISNDLLIPSTTNIRRNSSRIEILIANMAGLYKLAFAMTSYGCQLAIRHHNELERKHRLTFANKTRCSCSRSTA